MRGSTSVGYDQFETSPEAIEQELRPAVCECRLTERLKVKDPVAYFFRKILYDDYTKLLLIILSS